MSEEADFEELLGEAFALPSMPRPAEVEAWYRCLRCGHVARLASSACPRDGAPMVQDGDGRLGQLVGEYRILERLGSGGAGTVYRARHRTLGREAAIKFLRSDLARNREHRARLMREARVIGHLDHDHIVRVIELLTSPDGSPVLVMELARGRTLNTALTVDGRFSPARALHVGRQIARALVRAHGLGVLHRDIKPSNVLLGSMGEEPDFVKVLDFGIARVEQDLALTHSHSLVGTPLYMSPEQARRTTLGPQSDLYSLGCVLFELACGQPPFAGSTAMVMHAQVYTPAPALRDLAPEVPEAVAQLVARLLRKDPTERFADADALLQSIENILPQVLEDETPPPPPPPAASTPAKELQTRVGQYLTSLEQSLAATSPEQQKELSTARLAVDTLEADGAKLERRANTAYAEVLAQNERTQPLRRALSTLDEELCRAKATGSKTSQLLADAEKNRALAVDRLYAATQALPRCAPHVALSDAEVHAVNEVQSAAGALARSEQGHAQALARRTSADALCADLRFQISQIRERLASLEVEGRVRSAAAQGQLSTLQARYERSLEAAVEVVDHAAKQLATPRTL